MTTESEKPAGKGHCKHGEFILDEGCPQCIAERRAGGIRPEWDELEDGLNDEGLTLAVEKPRIVKVKYYSETTGELSTREYTYFTADPLKVGDILIVPVRDTTGKAKVSAINVPEAEIANFKDKVKTIPTGSVIEPLPQGKPGDDWKEIKPLGPLTDTRTAAEKVEDAAPVEFDLGQVVDGTTAIINIAPESDLVILSLVAEANRLRDYAEKRVIATDADMTLAVDDLSIIAKVKKALIAKKDEYLKPIKAHEDAIKAVFQIILTPVEDADRINREKWTNYRTEQARHRDEAEAINREKLELAKREEVLTGEHTIDLTPVVAPAPVTRIQTDMGSAGMRDNWTYEVTDFVAQPNEFKVADTAMLNSIAKKYHDQKQVAGVRFINKPILAVNTK